MSENKQVAPPPLENKQDEEHHAQTASSPAPLPATKKKSYSVPGFYWNMYQPKSYAPAPSLLRGGFVNKEQKRFYYFVTFFKFAKIAAIILVALFIIGWL